MLLSDLNAYIRIHINTYTFFFIFWCEQYEGDKNTQHQFLFFCLFEKYVRKFIYLCVCAATKKSSSSRRRERERERVYLKEYETKKIHARKLLRCVVCLFVCCCRREEKRIQEETFEKMRRREIEDKITKEEQQKQ